MLRTLMVLAVITMFGTMAMQPVSADDGSGQFYKVKGKHKTKK